MVRKFLDILALDKPIKVSSDGSPDIGEYAQALVDKAKGTNRDVEGEFNGIRLIIKAGVQTSVADVLEDYNRQTGEEFDAWAESPAGQQAIKETPSILNRVRPSGDDSTRPY
jgi:hypothetical protein